MEAEALMKKNKEIGDSTEATEKESDADTIKVGGGTPLDHNEEQKQEISMPVIPNQLQIGVDGEEEKKKEDDNKSVTDGSEYDSEYDE